MCSFCYIQLNEIVPISRRKLMFSFDLSSASGQTQKSYGITSPISLAGPKPGVSETSRPQEHVDSWS